VADGEEVVRNTQATGFGRRTLEPLGHRFPPD
jgi:hypothetical protein